VREIPRKNADEIFSKMSLKEERKMSPFMYDLPESETTSLENWLLLQRGNLSVGFVQGI
jgi:hypothetical protein